MFVNIGVYEYIDYGTRDIILRRILDGARLEIRKRVTYGLHFPLLSPYEVSQQALT